MKRLLITLLLMSAFALSKEVMIEANKTSVLKKRDQQQQEIKQLEIRYKIAHESVVESKSIWVNTYNNFYTFKSLEAKNETLKQNIRSLKQKRQTKEVKEEIAVLKKEQELVKNKLELLPQVGVRPFDELLSAPELPKAPEMTNPFSIFAGFSYTKQIEQLKDDYSNKAEQLEEVLELLRMENEILSEIYFTSKMQLYVKRYKQSMQQLEHFESAHQILQSTIDVYTKRIDDLVYKMNFEIQNQAKDILRIGVIIAVLFILTFLIKLVIRKYIKDHERFYMANKILNFGNFVLISLVLFIAYIDNVGYLVTVLGFASAGIAIAMKDWFMSVLGWLVIVIGGSIHVGDRIKFQKDGMVYVGDVLDISLFRITLMEDITLTTYTVNRRAGRIIFVPNNYVFTSMIANYSHNSLKTVWDGIDITITFDSNHKKATFLAKEISRKYSKGYTDITRKQLNKLRDRYSLKNTNVEPRIFVFAEPNGLRISTWYLTNAFATLTLRTTITTELIDAFNKEKDINIAYPTQTLTYAQEIQKPPVALPMDTL